MTGFLERWESLDSAEQRRRTGRAQPAIVADTSATPDSATMASEGQTAQFILDEAVGDAPSPYAVPFAIELEGSFNLNRLAHAVRAVIEAFPVLRTRFHAQGAEILGTLPSDRCPPVDILDVQEPWTTATTLACRPLRMRDGELFTATILRGPTPSRPTLLVLIGHHAVLDGQSMAMVLEMVAVAYRTGLPPDVAPRTSYRELVSAGRSSQEDVPSDVVESWRTLLGEHPPAFLPPDVENVAAINPFAGDHVTVTVDRPDWDRLRAVAGGVDAADAVAALACVSTVVGRHSDTPEAVYGLSVTGRADTAQLSCIGPFADTVPVPVQTAARMPLASVLAAMAGGPAMGRGPKEVPFAALVRSLGAPRLAHRNPLYDVLVTMDPYASWESSPIEPGLRWRVRPLFNGTARVALQVTFAPGPREVVLRFDYATSRYTRRYIDQLAAQVVEVIRAVRTGAEQIGELAAHDPGEIATTPHPVGPSESALVRFDRQVSATPDAVCIDGSTTMTYRDLDAWSDRIAAYLVRHTDPGDVVASTLGVGALAAATILAVFKAGCQYLPLDGTAPRRRIEAMSADAHARLTLGTDDDESEHHGSRVLTVAARPGDVWVDRIDVTVPMPAAPRRDCPGAYIMFTSGTTGRPKGVQVSHRALSTFIAAMLAEKYIDQGNRVLAATAPTFDISLDELLLPLLVGGTVVFVAGSGARIAGPAVDSIEAGEIDIVHGTPSFLKVLLATGWTRRVKRIIVGGEALAADTAQLLADRAAEVVNVYGPTEATVWALHEVVTRPSAGAASTPAIGVPLAGYTAWISTDGGPHPLPRGAIGELCIAGDALANGYLGDLKLTAERFVPSADIRYYRTGDLARRSADGRFHCLGRTDGQVKIRGHRVELGEIETAARLCGATDAAAAVVDGAVHLLVVGDPLRVTEVARELPSYLPAVMVPAVIAPTAAVPRTRHGKVDRTAVASQTRQSVAQIPAGEIEIDGEHSGYSAWVAELWTTMTGRPVGLGDSIFDSGGHSLLLARTVTHAREMFALTISFRDMFTAPTPQGVGRLMDDAQADLDELIALVEGLSTAEVRELTDG